MSGCTVWCSVWRIQIQQTLKPTFLYVHSQHNCISNYIPYFAAFEITRKVAVSDGKVERPCQGATRGEFEGFYQTATCFKGIKCNYYAIIGNGRTWFAYPKWAQHIWEFAKCYQACGPGNEAMYFMQRCRKWIIRPLHEELIQAWDLHGFSLAFKKFHTHLTPL